VDQTLGGTGSRSWPGLLTARKGQHYVRLYEQRSYISITLVSNSVARALRLLELMAGNVGEPMRLSELAAGLAAPKSSIHGILRSLVDARFVEQTEAGSYRLGVRIFEVGSAYSRHMSPARAVHAELVDLSHELRVTAHYAILDGPDVLYVEKEDPPGPGVLVWNAVGTRLPAHLTAVGKAALAYSDSSAIAHLNLSIRGKSGRPVTRSSLNDELDTVRQNGYAVDHAETAVGIRCVAAPVFDAKKCCGAVGVSYLTSSDLPTATAAERVHAAADRASRRLGAPGVVG
jgi:DNA-binding IclR family transcriptional regulator